MSKASDKLSKLMKNLNKLSPERKVYWLKELKKLQASYKTIEKELGAEPESDWLLSFANQLDKIYNYTASGIKSIPDKVDNVSLLIANRVDKVYNAVADEVAKIPKTTGKAIGQLTGTGDYWPYLLGAAIALGTVYYVKTIA